MTNPRVTADVRAALEQHTPVVALETSVLAQGLAPPHNKSAALGMASAIIGNHATPVFTAIVRGRPAFGLEPLELERFLTSSDIRKVSSRDLAMAIADGVDGATTVAGTLALCRLGGPEIVATGGIGGVHRNAPYDESTDLLELSRSLAMVVCSGAKSILDLPATLERLETAGVTVVGFRTKELPGFFTTTTGLPLTAWTDDERVLARAWLAHRALERPGAMLVVQSPPAHVALDPALVERATERALARASDEGIRGGAVTPFLLAEIERATNGASVETNLALLAANAGLAARVARAVHAERATPHRTPPTQGIAPW